MKLSLPRPILAAVLTALFLQPATALEIPDEYIPVDVWTPDFIAGCTDNSSSDYYAFVLWTDDVEFTPKSYPDWTSTTPLFTGGNLIFTTVEGYEPMSVKFSGGSSQVFQLPTNITFDTLSHLNISNQTGSKSVINLSQNGTLHIHNIDNGIKKTDNTDVIFSQNQITQSRGGVIYAAGNNSLIDISYNGEVAINSNSISYPAYGGAIYSEGTIKLNNNSCISFCENSVASTSHTHGGAIYTTGVISINNNTNVIFERNTTESTYSYGASSSTSSQGGAICSTNAITINNNSDVLFNGNSTYAYYKSYGGAIYSTNSLEINNNSNVSFVGNHASTATSSSSSANGGAIYSKGAISMIGNSSVTFKMNYVKEGSYYQLRSIYMDPASASASLILAAKSGGHITFYDSVYMGYYSGATVSFNADYQDVNGVTQKATGDIIFSGEFTKAHLEDIKGKSASSSEITNSRTSYIDNLITLYGGSLQVVDGAKLNVRGLTAVADSGAKLLLRNGSMSRGGYSFNFHNGTTLELQGHNTLTAGDLHFKDGSTLTATIGESNFTNAALNLGSTSVYTYSDFTINLESASGMRSGMYKILSTNSSSYFQTASNWTATNVTVNGSGDAVRADFNDLVWENGTLYYKVGRNIWGNASGDSLWNTSSDNWTMNDRSYTYLNGMDVYFTDFGSGKVKLVGDVSPASIEVNNSEGNDYDFIAADCGGKLSGDTGITKNGTGALTISTANEHTGDTVVNSGTLNVHHSTALGATAYAEGATVTTAVGSTLTIDNKSHVVLAAKNDIKGAVSIAEGSTLEIRNKGYASESSTVTGTLHFNGQAAATTNVGTLSGTGTVKVTDCSVTIDTLSGTGTVKAANSLFIVNKLSNFTGDMEVTGAAATLSIRSGNYSGTGNVSISGRGATLNTNSGSVTMRSESSLSFSSDNGGAVLETNRLTISSGAELSAEALAAAASLQIEDVQIADGYDSSTAFNTVTGGTITANMVTLSMGSTYAAKGASLSLNYTGELTLAVTKTATNKINLVLDSAVAYRPESQVVLFTEVAVVNFIADNSLEAIAGDGLIYTLEAAKYFEGDWINDDTRIVYDSNTAVLYLENINTVPEPTTTTLSLLALAALAARRRRK